MRRIPVWITLLPLVAGIAVWWWLWQGYADGFRARLLPLIGDTATIRMGGFPYRLEADVQQPAFKKQTDALLLQLGASRMLVNRVPWQNDRQVLTLATPEAVMAATLLQGASARITAPDARASLRIAADGSIARLSVVWRDASLASGLFAGKVRAEMLETHMRETPKASPDAETDNSPRGPVRAEVDILGRELRFGAGQPLSLDMQMQVTADRKLASYAGWAAGGTVEITSARLADKSGEIASFSATLVPDGEGRLRIAGTVETVCPANVRAAMAGAPPAVEQRLRRAATIAFSGLLPGQVEAEPADSQARPGPVRGQLPPCPGLG